jgi:hypothetical protein
VTQHPPTATWKDDLNGFCQTVPNFRTHLWHHWRSIEFWVPCLLRPAANAPEEAPLDIYSSSEAA